MRTCTTALLLALLFSGYLAVPVQAQTDIRVTDDKATLDFPQNVTFQASIQAGAEIKSITLEYGVEQLTCGEVIAKAFPDFTPAKSASVNWTWEMLQSGSLPPGAAIWWQWRVTDVNGIEFVSPRQTVTWLDSLHDWQVVAGGDINLHYYEGDQAFTDELHTAAVDALSRLAQDTGIGVDKPVDIYIYANTTDMLDAIFYEPGWTGGVAFPENNIVIIGIPLDQLDWGKRTEAHELTHVLVGHQTFSCLGFVPTWLNEGLAVFGEGGPDENEQTRFNQAVTDDKLVSIRSLSGGFSEEGDRADLSYTESYSIVKYLLDTYGRDSMTTLLTQLRDGATVDSALQAVYEFDVDGLEDAWRAAIGAKPRAGGAQPTPVSTPTAVPTIAPVAGIPAVPASPTPRPTRPVTPTAIAPSPTRRASIPSPTPSGVSIPFLNKDILSYVGIGLIFCVVAILAIGGPVLLTVRRRRRRTK